MQVTKFHLFIASGFGSGFSPVAPGTAGALLACVMWGVASLFLPYEAVMWATGVCVLLFTALGLVSAGKAEQVWGKDPSKVVIDEMVGVWIPLLAAPEGEARGWYALGAFVLFRFFDIVKPLGVRRMERLEGGLGIMMDDILAGIYSLIILIGIRCFAG